MDSKWPKASLKDLSIRTGCVRDLKKGYLLACDLKREAKGIPHTYYFKWDNGKLSPGYFNFDAWFLCDVTVPEPGLVALASEGQYCFICKGPNGHAGNAFKESTPKRKDKRYGNFRSIATIGGSAHAVGLQGLVYRLDKPSQWTRIDEGLPKGFDGQAIHGDGTSLYAVGRSGQLWQFKNGKWISRKLPTKRNLTAITCANNEMFYIAGHNGALMCGRENKWTAIESGITEDIWDLEWFGGELYVSTLSNVYKLKGNKLKPVNFGGDPPKTTYRLSSAKGVLWSIGNKDVLSFDLKKWKRIV
jgi:hypothetical protein